MSRRAGDPPELVAGVSGAIETLKWRPTRPTIIDQIVDAWKWHSNYFG